MNNKLKQCRFWKDLDYFIKCGECEECKWYQGQQNPNWRDEN